MLTKLAVLTLVSFGCGMLVPLPEHLVANGEADAKVATVKSEPTLVAKTVVVDGSTVVTYSEANDPLPRVAAKREVTASHPQSSKLTQLPDPDAI